MSSLEILAFKALVVIATVVALFATYKGWEHRLYERGYTAAREETIAQWNKANAAAIARQRADQLRYQQQKEQALNEASKREQALRADLSRVSAQRDGLRDELAASRAAIGTASVEALRKRTAALTDVFEECVDAYRGVAEKADRHAADALTFERAWPQP